MAKGSIKAVLLLYLFILTVRISVKIYQRSADSILSHSHIFIYSKYDSWFLDFS